MNEETIVSDGSYADGVNGVAVQIREIAVAVDTMADGIVAAQQELDFQGDQPSDPGSNSNEACPPETSR